MTIKLIFKIISWDKHALICQIQVEETSFRSLHFQHKSYPAALVPPMYLPFIDYKYGCNFHFCAHGLSQSDCYFKSLQAFVCDMGDQLTIKFL